METQAGRPRRWLIRLLIVTVVAISVVPIADYCWFRFRVPVGFHANWSGSWRSAQYRIAEGKLLANLPKPLPPNQEFQADVLVYYPIYFPYRGGQFVRMNFKGHYSPDDSSASGTTPPVRKSPRVPPDVEPNDARGNQVDAVGQIPWTLVGGSEELGKGKVRFTGTFEGQSVEYSALIDDLYWRMVGGYLSTSPDDSGMFTIKAH